MSVQTQLHPTNNTLHLPRLPPMDPLSASVSILSLVGVFDNAMTFFACLRLSRWGKVVGLEKKIDNDHKLESTALDEQEMLTAKQVLEQIEALFKMAKKDHPDLIEAPDANGDTVFEMIDRMSICKPRRTSIVEKAKWAVYKKEDMSKLVEGLKELVSNLFELISGQTDMITKLCNEEVSQLLEQGRLNGSALSLLQEAAEALDTKLADAIAKRRNQIAATSTINNHNHGKALNMGNVINGDQTNHFTF
ncbi:small s protein [Venturia nashicola]|nr:small s protein [Venturia nashicola]